MSVNVSHNQPSARAVTTGIPHDQFIQLQEPVQHCTGYARLWFTTPQMLQVKIQGRNSKVREIPSLLLYMIKNILWELYTWPCSISG